MDGIKVIHIMDNEDTHRFRREGRKRWYIDGTARSSVPGTGEVPRLTWSGDQLEESSARDLLGYLDSSHPHLINLQQHSPHFDPARGRTTDPNEHTVEVMALLDTSQLAPRDQYLARVAVLFHDVGKGRDPFDPDHPLESARIAAAVLPQFGLGEQEQELVLLHIREHALLGTLSRGRMTPAEAIARLQLQERSENLALHYAIATADISAIRGLRWIIEQGQIREAHNVVARALL
ncbi:MAG: HD domain-containing protein [Chloroflexi bacterium]|nr:HD domain-containing protein [Chloroflexota bacterium]